MSSSYNQEFRNNENGYHWDLNNCTCCPYGYHIDLDFVRYCESVSQEADRTGSIKRRKDRRRQRQSMEVLLGLTAPVIEILEQKYKTIEEQETPKIITSHYSSSRDDHDGFDDAVSDFEKTLQRSKKKLSNNLPDVTAVTESTIKRVPSTSSVSSASGSGMTVLPETTNRDFDTVSIESCGLSPLALQNVREQMALSLERTRILENQVKSIPQLKSQVTSLTEENRLLQVRLKSEEAKNLNTINANYIHVFPQNNRLKSQSFAHIENLDAKKEAVFPPRKDFGVNCGVLTRNVGVGHQTPHTKSVSTTTFDEKWKLLDSPIQNVTRSSQTIIKENRIGASQTLLDTSDHSTQTQAQKKYFSDASVAAFPKLIDFSTQKTVEASNIGVSDDTISDIKCDKCNVLKCSVSTGPDSSEDTHTIPVSLSSLMGSKSKSFNLGDAKMDYKLKKRTIACQYDLTGISKASQYEPTGIHKASQSEIKTNSKACQHETKSFQHKNTQSDSTIKITRDTDTKDLIIPTKNIACETKDVKEESCVVCEKCLQKDDVIKKDLGTGTPSKIPRPQIPTTPVEIRKFRRQDTYTKIYSTGTSPPLGLSGLDLSDKLPSPSDLRSSLENVKKNLKIPETNQYGANGSPPKVPVQKNTLPISETTLLSSASNQAYRKKTLPSKEMQGALKVLNDSLQKSQTKNLKNTSAISIIEQEWFKISSVFTANPLEVEDYLDSFEDYSSLLLQYVVNMSDESGNTAMHYAVSHGNFDVVSILLDSKVCDINRSNKAGYTSVMLVSLADMRSQTHSNVVKRLFQLADVNIRAKQHGQTALMLAVSHGRLNMVKMLLEAGADINIQDEDGSTALMCAAEHGHVDIVKHFLEQPDCDSSITDIDGSNALKISMEAGHRHIGVLLYAHERSFGMIHGRRKSKPSSPKTPSPLPIRSSHRALTDTKTTK